MYFEYFLYTENKNKGLHFQNSLHNFLKNPMREKQKTNVSWGSAGVITISYCRGCNIALLLADQLGQSEIELAESKNTS